ncbi:hypothetical protein Tco_0972545 [Tanacetum coccineum]
MGSIRLLNMYLREKDVALNAGGDELNSPTNTFSLRLLVSDVFIMDKAACRLEFEYITIASIIRTVKEVK